MKLTTQSTDYTSFHGVIVKTTVKKLKDALGRPQYSENSGRDKSNFVWGCENKDGEVVTIYDYKEYKPINEDEEINFHIGGFSLISTLKGKEELESLLGLG